MVDAPAGAPTDPGRGGRWSDLLASLVVFMVALPLCVGIAQACGLPAEAGLVTGVVGGLLVGLFSGSPLQVSGPAAGLIVLVIQFLDDARAAGHAGAAAVALLGVAIFLAGALQVAAGALRLGQWFRAVSPAVVGGMLAGIGITIIAKQFYAMFDDAPPKGVVEGLTGIPAAVWADVGPGADPRHRAAALIGVVTILVLVFWKKVAPARVKLVPAAVVGVLLAVGINEAAGFGIARVAIGGDFLSAFRPIDWPGWGVLGLGLVWKAAVTFAVIASAETLLCAVAVDTMHTGPRTKFDRELAAQGVGNMVCGTLGALPMTGVIVRSSANVEAGARTRLSTILHGLWLLLFVALLPGALSRIPVAALAAVLVYTGWKLVNPHGVWKLWKTDRGEAAIFVATAAGIVATDLLAGVLLGVGLSAAKLLWHVSHVTVTRRDDPDTGDAHLMIDGAATFVRLPAIANALEAVPRGRAVHVHLEQLRFVDHAVLELLMTFQKQYEATGGTVWLDWDQLHAHFARLPALKPDANQSPASQHKDGNGVVRPAPSSATKQGS